MTCNGWTNYPTWNAALWIDNDAGLYNQHLELANQADSIHTLSDTLKDWFEEIFPLPENGPLADIAGWAYQEINWRELAEHYWDERKEEVEA